MRENEPQGVASVAVSGCYMVWLCQVTETNVTVSATNHESGENMLDFSTNDNSILLGEYKTADRSS